jgi:hypothetical protein
MGTAFTLLPHESRQVPFAITVPADADGTYFGVLLVTPEGEERVGVVDGASLGEPPSLTIREVVRYAVEVVVDVLGTAAVSIAFDHPAIEEAISGPPTFTLTAHNGGGRWAAAVDYRFDLFDAESGTLLASTRQARGRLYPGAGHRLALPLLDLAPGAYQLLVVADADTDVVFATFYPLAVGDDRGISLELEDAP